jgi:hypothetical protein
MTKEQALQEQMDEIMDSFEFDKVLSVMQHLNWEWKDAGVPDEYEIRKSARRTIKSAIEYNGTSSTGGFTAIVDDNPDDGWVRLDLHFGFSTINDGVEYEKNS